MPSLGLVQKPLGCPPAAGDSPRLPRCVLKKLSRLPRLLRWPRLGLRARAPRTTGLPLLAVHLSPESPDLGAPGALVRGLSGVPSSPCGPAPHRATTPPPVAQNQCSLVFPAGPQNSFPPLEILLKPFTLAQHNLKDRKMHPSEAISKGCRKYNITLVANRVRKKQDSRSNRARAGRARAQAGGAESPLLEDPQDENSMEGRKKSKLAETRQSPSHCGADIQLLSCGRGIKSDENADKSGVVQTNTRVLNYTGFPQNGSSCVLTYAQRPLATLPGGRDT